MPTERKTIQLHKLIATIIERHIRFPALAGDISSVQATTTCRYDLTTAGGGRSVGILGQEDQILVAGANLAKIGVQGCRFLHDALHSDPHYDFDGVLQAFQMSLLRIKYYPLP
jgi:hypothetical protein